MASKVALLNALYDQFGSFVAELKDMYPDDADFAGFAMTLKMLRSTNPSILAKYIVENTVSFEDQIMSKNEDFFMNQSYDEYAESVNLSIFSKLKSYVANMTPESKENVWKYIQNIFRLAKVIHSQSS
jgi:hypothetical protein